MSIESYCVSHEKLSELCASILETRGVLKGEAEIVAKSLVEADLKGVSSHGVIRLPLYINRLDKGGNTANSEIKLINETSSTALLDGGNVLGQIVSEEAMKIAIEKAKDSNISMVTVRNSNHNGAAAYWALKALEHDMIGIAFSNVEPLMPPPGGAAARLGNNPIAFAVPADQENPIVFDMATSVVAIGKVVVAKSKGESVPTDWGVDKNGNKTSNPEDILNGGFLLPVGGAKGYGLSILVDILSSLLSEGAIGDEIHSLYKDLENPNRVSHAFIAIKIGAFVKPEIFRKTVDRYVQYIRNTPLAEGSEKIYLPGEIELMNKEKNLQQGITIPKTVLDEIIAIAKEANVPSELVENLIADNVY